MAATDPPVLRLSALHRRHFGVTEQIGGHYEQAAAVCLSWSHAPPVLMSVVADDGPSVQYLTEWLPPTPRQRAAWANAEDATANGAYCVALAAAESHLGLVALSRAETKSGADYYVGSAQSGVAADQGDLSLDDAVRLEISGIGLDEREAVLGARVRQKVAQARRGLSNRPALVCVVAFRLLRVVFRRG